MSRIRKAYEARFRWLLQHVHARRVEQGVHWLTGKAARMSAQHQLTPADGLTRVYEALVMRPAFRDYNLRPAPERFYCDAGLGGLARWLRAAGYEAHWEPGIDDSELLRRAHQLSATLLTTDSMLMERRLVSDRTVAALWLPPTLSLADQLLLVFREFRLRRRSPRCMQCGGRLHKGDKEALRERIPPRTYLWLNEFFVCERCGKLFWHGTHWRRIQMQLEKVELSL